MTACKEPSSKKSNALLHVLAKRNWREYGEHRWTEYEELIRTSVQLAQAFPAARGIDARNDKGHTPLMAAVSSGNSIMAFELVRAKCDVNAEISTAGQPDRTAMDLAAAAKRTDIIDELKRHGGRGLCKKKQAGGGFESKRSRRG